MSLAVGSKLGPDEILTLIGSRAWPRWCTRATRAARCTRRAACATAFTSPRIIPTIAPRRTSSDGSTATMCSCRAYLLKKLPATPDGDGTLLNHSMVLYGSSMSNGNQHDHNPLPVILASRADGRLQGG